MSDTDRHSVICDLTGPEYRHQIALSSSDPQRRAPRLIRHTANGHLIGEHHMAQIASDAWTAAYDSEPSDAAQTQIDELTRNWLLRPKAHYLELAGEHWIPPVDEDTSQWDGTRLDARNFLATYPLIIGILIHDQDHTQPLVPQLPIHTEHPSHSCDQMALAAAQMMQEMTAFPYDSTDWQDRWERVKETLDTIAFPAGSEQQ